MAFMWLLSTCKLTDVWNLVQSSYKGRTHIPLRDFVERFILGFSFRFLSLMGIEIRISSVNIKSTKFPQKASVHVG